MTQEVPTHGAVVSPTSIEIDHIGIRKYLCSEALSTFAFLAALMLGAQVMVVFFNLIAERAWDTLPLATLGAGWIFLILAVLGYMCGITIYFARMRGLLIRQADEEGMSIEGSFLHIRQFTGGIADGSMNLGGDVQDTKVHCRAIVSYSIYQDHTMRRHGIQSLQLITTSRGKGSKLLIRGIKDCERVRDMLAAVGARCVE